MSIVASRGKVHTTMFHWCLHIVHIYVIVASISEDTCAPYTSEEGISVAKLSSIMGLDKTESNLSKATVASQPMHLGSPPCALFRQNPTYKISHVVQEQAEDEEKKVGEEERDERCAPKKVRPSVLAKDTAKLEAGMGCARLRSPTEGVSSDTRTATSICGTLGDDAIMHHGEILLRKAQPSVLVKDMAKLEAGVNIVIADGASHAHAHCVDTPSISKSHM